MTDCWTTLVDAPTLAARMAKGRGRPLAIVDARVVLTDRSAGAARFAESHLPGARHADLETDLSGPHTPGAGRHPWPGDEAFGRTLGRLGISPDHQVVAYDDAGGALAAARVWCLLRAWGHRCVAVLDGGWSAWAGAGYPTEAGPADEATGEYAGRFDRGRLLATADVAARLGRDLILDARAAERYRGDVEPLDRRAGHIPGAVNRPFGENLDEGRFKPAARLRAEFEALLAGREPADVLASCGSGVTACHHLLAMEHAGLRGARLYTGSWSGWIEDDARPIATGSG